MSNRFFRIAPILFILLALSANASATTTNSIILLPNTSIPQYAPGAEALFAAGIVISITLILMTFMVYDFRKKNGKYALFDGILGFALGMSAVILLLFSLFYTSTMATPAYTINEIGNAFNVANQTIASLPLGTSNSFGLVASIFLLLDIFLSFAYLFIIGIVYNIGRKEKKLKEE